jgi:hypothetical protein
MTTKTIIVPRVDIKKLRKQRDWFQENCSFRSTIETKNNDYNGLLAMLDEMLDIAEGFGHD